MFWKSPSSRFRSFAFAQSASNAELRRLDRLSTTVHIPAGRVLMRQGDFGNEVLLLVDGELMVERDGEAVAVVTPGAAVGEQAVILNAPRNATVRAATDATILALNRSEFHSVLEECPTIGRNILSEAFARAVS